MYTQSKKFGYKARYGCKYCKAKNTHWAETEYGWVMFDKKTGRRHECVAKTK
jgi:hypothetical protein